MIVLFAFFLFIIIENLQTENKFTELHRLHQKNKRQGNLLLWIFPAAKVIVLYLKGYATTCVERNERADRMCRLPKGIRAMPKVLFSSSTK